MAAASTQAGKILTVAFDGKVTLPQDLLEHLGIRPGEQLWVDFVIPHGLLLRSVENVEATPPNSP